MPQPYNYSMQAEDPGAKFMQGLQIANALGVMKQQKLAQEKAQADAAEKARQNELYKVDLQGAIQNPTQAAWLNMIAKHPDKREAFDTVRKGYSEEQLKNEFDQGFQISTALETDNPEVAKETLATIIEAKKNRGEQAGIYQQAFDMLEAGNITGAKAITNMGLSILDPDRFKKSVDSLAAQNAEKRQAELAPSQLTEQQAKAAKAATDAKFAESEAVADLSKKGWDITKIQEDIAIAKENSRIAAMNADYNKEQNLQKKDELKLKIADAVTARDEKVNEKAAQLDTARAGIDHSMSTIDELLANPELDNVLGSLEGQSWYPSTLMAMRPNKIVGMDLIPGPDVDSDTRSDALRMIETIQSQEFINNLVKVKNQGAVFGALSDSEGAKLMGYQKNLSTAQSEVQFKKNLTGLQTLLLKARNTLATKHGVPATAPVTPEVNTPASIVDSLVNKYYPGGQ